MHSVGTTGKGMLKNDAFFELPRDGYTEEVYFSYSYNPIFKSDGSVCAVFVLAQETTHKVLNTRRLKTLDQLNHQISEADSLENACHIITKVLSVNNADIPYAIIYFVEHKSNIVESLIARLMATTFDYDNEKGWIFPDFLPETPKIIDLANDAYPELNRENETYLFLEYDSWPLHLLLKEGDHIKVRLKDGSHAVLLLTKVLLVNAIFYRL
ncbi:protein-histidine kinase [Gigaspora margarita]|uniref:Protein-histidine kinase n=1 Tax=Gigaspora margarita TaxID=4874 RepID=A0A8H3X761_GIGMA|nr:protein-histidine kinase [Gigaspora margarita]